jgi:hypothetical protein
MATELKMTDTIETRGRPPIYDQDDIIKLVGKGRWASWKTLSKLTGELYGMSPRTLSRYLRRLRGDGVFVLHDHLYHRIK